MRPPLVQAHAVSPSSPPPPPPRDDALSSHLSSFENQYVRGMKKRDRTQLARFFSSSSSKKRAGADSAPLRIRVLQSSLPESVRLSIFEDLKTGACDKYVKWVKRALSLPMSVEKTTLVAGATTVRDKVLLAKARMDAHITGHDVAKEEVLKLVCQVASGSTCASAYSIGFEGPPGTGKTHFVKNALRAALGREMVSIPLGGATDACFLLGSLYHYEGSKEGSLAAGLIETGCCNPIFHFDELDKISTTDRGMEIVSVLIHLIDPTQNTALRDRYFHGIDLDFSRCTFVFTYNDPSRVHPVLLDRIKRVSMPSPTEEERRRIAREHIEPRARERMCTSLSLSDDALSLLLSRSGGGGGGMRGVEKEVDHVLSCAQLCEAYGGTPCDEEGKVAADYASKCLLSVDAGKKESSSPPCGMYS